MYTVICKCIDISHVYLAMYIFVDVYTFVTYLSGSTLSTGVRGSPLPFPSEKRGTQELHTPMGPAQVSGLC